MSLDAGDFSFQAEVPENEGIKVTLGEGPALEEFQQVASAQLVAPEPKIVDLKGPGIMGPNGTPYQVIQMPGRAPGR